MAGDWIKIRADLFDDSDVMQMSDILGCDDALCVGLLVRFWTWADRQTVDGHGLAVTWARIDRLVGREGFAEAMRRIGWLSGEDGAVHLPNFDRHNGQSAKARAMEAQARRIRRGLVKAEPCPTSGGRVSDAVSEPCPTSGGILSDTVSDQRREEKRESTREDVEVSNPGSTREGAAATAAALDFREQAHVLCESYLKRDRSRPAIRAAAECLRRHQGQIRWEEILSATQAISEVMRGWPEQERIMYAPSAIKFFSEDQWRRPVESWASRRAAQRALQRHPPVDIGGRKPELFRFQDTP